MLRTGPIAVTITITVCCIAQVAGEDVKLMDTADRIKPYKANPRYWQHKGEPVLLVGGSKDDNLFQIPDVEEHLDLLASVGGNVIRNTMSDRPDFGFEVYPFAKLNTGKYDLDQWNEEYWRRFETMLRLTAERDIIVQIEVWDRFDYSQDNWGIHPHNPSNNVNYTSEESGLAASYPAPAWRDRQPFFHSIPGMPMYKEQLDVVRGYQERFVRRMLSHSLRYGHVLYCMNNETSTPVEWGKHWIALIQAEAAEAGAEVYATDMFDDVWSPHRSAKLKHAFANPGIYPFIDISQVNSRSFGQEQWDLLTWIHAQNKAAPRPLNNTKIYCDGETNWGSGTPKDGPERFWRQLLAGAASARFHRDGGGIGLNELAQACIRSARLAEERVRLWDVEAHMELLSERDDNEAYLAADPGRAYLLFLTDGGSVKLDLRQLDGTLRGRWIDARAGAWGDSFEIAAGDWAAISAPGEGPWVAALTK